MLDDIFMNEIIDSMGEDRGEEKKNKPKPCMICGEYEPDCCCWMED